MGAMRAQILVLCLAISTALGNFVIPRRNMCSGKQNGEQIASTLDCAAYFVCIHGLPEIFRCSDNLLYDDEINVCNWPENVACGQLANPIVEPVQPAPDVSNQQPTQEDPSNRPQEFLRPESTWVHPNAPKPVAPQLLPSVTVHNQVQPLTKPQVEELPGYLHVQGIPEVEGQAEQALPSLDSPLPTPPNPQSSNAHLEAVRPERPKYSQEGTPEVAPPTGVEHKPPPYSQEGTPEFAPSAGGEYIPNQLPQAIAPAAQEIPAHIVPSGINGMIEYYPGISYDKWSTTNFRCTIDYFYFAPHPTSCQKYFICVNKKAYEHQCGDGIFWDYIGSKCDFAKKSLCYKDTHEVSYENAHDDQEDAELPPFYVEEPSQVDPGFNGEWVADVVDQKPKVDAEAHKEDQQSIDDRFNQFFESTEQVNKPLGNANKNPDIEELPLENRFDQYFESAENAAPEFVSNENQGWDALPNWNSKEGFMDMDSGFNPEGLNSAWNSKWDQDTKWQGAAIPVASSVESDASNQHSNEAKSESDEDEDWLPECPEKEQSFYPYQKDNRKYYICISGMPILTSCPENMTWDTAYSQCRA